MRRSLGLFLLGAAGAHPSGPVGRDRQHAINLFDDVLAGRGTDLLVGGKNAINSWNDVLDSVKNEGNGLYYAFSTARGDKVWSGQVEGRPGTWATETTAFPLASISKLYTALAVMRTMELRPKDWHPEAYVNKFKGWESFSNFPVHGMDVKVNLTVHQLMTHTSGLPFGLRMSREDIQKQTLFYLPGTAFGYTLGHRVLGWVLRDYWKAQPETQAIGIVTVQDTFKWLIFDKLGVSCSTRFADYMSEAFGYSGEAGDASISSTGEDMSKLAVLALRRGSLPDGTVLVSKKNWNKWAVPNLLPGGKMSKDLVSWTGAAASWANWNVGDLKAKIMQQSGDFGWNYFGATYFDSKETGWCGFFSTCLHVSYTQDIAFVVMQQNIADLEKSKPYMIAHFDEMARSLQCKTKSKCVGWEEKSSFCESCGDTCQDSSWSEACPDRTERGKAVYPDTFWSSVKHTCYVPHCQAAWWAPWVGGSTCTRDTGGTCRFFGCSSSRGPTSCVGGACLCQEGYCAQEGVCQKPSALSTCCRDTGGTCDVFGCHASRNAQCISGKCICPEGQCAEAGHCLPTSALQLAELGNSTAVEERLQEADSTAFLLALFALAAFSASTATCAVLSRKKAASQQEPYVKLDG